MSVTKCCCDRKHGPSGIIFVRTSTPCPLHPGPAGKLVEPFTIVGTTAPKPPVLVSGRRHGKRERSAMAQAVIDAPRAHRVEVDRCGQCPFSHWDGGGREMCTHPEGKNRRVEDNAPPPDWCPLRGAVTMIAGPSRLEEKEHRDR